MIYYDEPSPKPWDGCRIPADKRPLSDLGAWKGKYLRFEYEVTTDTGGSKYVYLHDCHKANGAITGMSLESACEMAEFLLDYRDNNGIGNPYM